MKLLSTLSYLFLFLFSAACSQPKSVDTTKPNPYSKQLKEYWYSGLGEISSYKLDQARYGEIREGFAVLIFVTEDFSTKTLTKADKTSDDNISVLKLNSTRKFQTGIYPYSIMSSTFFPFPSGSNSIKISTSSQEWCGHTYLELIDKGKYEIANHSYFQSESDKHITLNKTLLEDDLWTLIRLNPDNLPTGEINMIPSFIYLRLSHRDTKSYGASAELIEKDTTTLYSVNYPELNRTLEIEFETEFPFSILAWSDTHSSGFGDDRKTLTTKGTLIKTIRTDYWTKNHLKDSVWNKKLGLE